MSRAVKFQLSRLQKKRLLVAKLALLCLLLLLVVLAFCQTCAQNAASLSLDAYMELPETEAGVDPLGIAGDELVFMRSSESGDILWYLSGAGADYTAMLVDRALTAAGWLALPSSQNELLSYSLGANGQHLGASAIVSINEQEQGCAVLFQLF